LLRVYKDNPGQIVNHLYGLKGRRQVALSTIKGYWQ
jgi:hypothetical protein